jgi:D-serine deaminase-like pyridoxal phosphate-dependent protein
MPDAASLLAEYRDRAMRQYGQAVGRRREDLVTPALVLDIDAAQRNIDRMASELRRIGPTTIRPHYKTHKSPDLARRQVEAGASGLSMATVWEAAVLAAAGFDDLFVVNTVAHPDKIRLLAELARDHRILVAVDDAAAAAAQSAAAVRAGSTVGIFVEVDTGMNRCGVDTAAEALALARQVSELPGLRFEGITGYEGHCTLTPSEDLRHSKQRQAMKLFTGAADLLEANGIACPIRSAGGIATWHWTAAYPGITEIQAGSYVVMDNFHGKMVPDFEHSLTIQASVISRQSKQVIVDVGNKSVADPFNVTIVGHDLEVFRSDEEHGIFAAPDGSPLRVGDCVTLVPGYSPSTVNCYDAFHVVQDDVVVDIWPIIPRGPGHHGLAPSAARAQTAAWLVRLVRLLWAEVVADDLLPWPGHQPASASRRTLGRAARRDVTRRRAAAKPAGFSCPLSRALASPAVASWPWVTSRAAHKMRSMPARAASTARCAGVPKAASAPASSASVTVTPR